MCARLPSRTASETSPDASGQIAERAAHPILGSRLPPDRRRHPGVSARSPGFGLSPIPPHWGAVAALRRAGRADGLGGMERSHARGDQAVGRAALPVGGGRQGFAGAGSARACGSRGYRRDRGGARRCTGAAAAVGSSGAPDGRVGDRGAICRASWPLLAGRLPGGVLCPQGPRLARTASGAAQANPKCLPDCFSRPQDVDDGEHARRRSRLDLGTIGANMKPRPAERGQRQERQRTKQTSR